MTSSLRAYVGATVLTATLAACGSDGPAVELSVPVGAGFSEVLDTLEDRGVVRRPGLFALYARLRGADREVRAGRYTLTEGGSWSGILRTLTRGEVMTMAMTIPEGFTLRQMAPRIAEVSGVSADSVMARLEGERLADELEVPGPTVEGYLFPDTYRFASGTRITTILRTMTDRYREMWTPERRARLAALEMTEREAVTLASIIQAEARHVEEMPTISGVYHRRLELGWLLQADPTVQYALGEPRERLLYAAIDSVADNPYNTYTQSGLPPGPIGAPGELAIEAALAPEGDYLYFVARPDGSHVFTRSLVEHNRAKAESQRMREAGDSGRS